MVYHRILNIVPCAIQQDLLVYPFFILLVSLFLVALGLCCCTQAFSSCMSRAYS